MRAANRPARLALLGLLAAAAGCGTKAPAITGVTVTVTMDGLSADRVVVVQHQRKWGRHGPEIADEGGQNRLGRRWLQT